MTTLTAQILSTRLCTRSCSPSFYSSFLPIYSSPQPCEEGSVIIPVSQIGPQRCREQRLAQGPSVGEAGVDCRPHMTEYG